MPLSPGTARWTMRSLRAPTRSRRRLLVVDDHLDGAESATMLLSLAGYDARFVFTGSAAFVALHEWTPEIVILDINMPGMDGFVVARQLRHDYRTQDLLIVAITAQDEAATRRVFSAVAFPGLPRRTEPIAWTALRRCGYAWLSRHVYGTASQRTGSNCQSDDDSFHDRPPKRRGDRPLRHLAVVRK